VRKRGDAAGKQEYSKHIRSGARQDKKAWRLQKLEVWSDPKTTWKYIKPVKGIFMPNFYGMKDLEGNRVPFNQKAEALASYLHQKQWAPKPEDERLPHRPERRKIFNQRHQSQLHSMRGNGQGQEKI
jgi:hypothetical protein